MKRTRFIRAKQNLGSYNTSDARVLLAKMKDLFDRLDGTDEELFEEYDLNALYETLSDTIMYMAHRGV